MPSFDVVSKVEEQEVDNAFQQAKKEIDQRYDFKGTDTGLERPQDPKDKGGIRLKSSTEERLNSAREVLVTKLAKRGISLRAVKYGDVTQSGKVHQQMITFAQGIEPEKAKALAKAIKDSKLKVTAAIQGDSLRISGKNKDDLQAAMALLRSKQEEAGVDIGFENFRD
jgi:uncharacterized protein YajQ (UPF0234 family)